jgi:hypothetical protein
MTIQEFAEVTFRVIAHEGFEGHVPTVLFPQRDHLASLEGIPADTDVEDASRRWASEEAQAGEEYLLVFKVDDARFKVIRHFEGALEERVFQVPDTQPVTTV